MKEFAAMSLLRIKPQCGLLATETGLASLIKGIPGFEICIRSDSTNKKLFLVPTLETPLPDRRDWNAGNPISDIHWYTDIHDIHWYTDELMTEQWIGGGIYGKWAMVF